MNVIQVPRELSKEATNLFVETLEEIFAEDQAVLLQLPPEDGETLEAVLVPVAEQYENFFSSLFEASGILETEFRWNDPEIVSQFGICVMQSSLSSGQQKFVFIGQKEDEEEAIMYFGLVDRKFFDQHNL